MGSGDRFYINTFPGISFGVFYNTWPFKHTITIHALCFEIVLGFGPGYDQQGYTK